MAKARTTRITIETDRVLIVAKLKGVRLTCEHCGQEVEWEAIEVPEPITLGPIPVETESFPRELGLRSGDDSHTTTWRAALRFLRGLAGGSPL